MKSELADIDQAGRGERFASAGVIIWLGLQLVAIALAIFRVPLWIHSPDATEFLATTLVFSAQIIAAAMLSPVLCSDASTAFIAMLTAWPFIAASAFLATASIGTACWMGTYVSAWIGAMWLLQSALVAKHRMNVAGLLIAWSILGPVALIFLRNERTDGSIPPLSPMMRAALGPLIAGFPSTSDPSQMLWRNWLPLGLVTIVGCGTKWGKAVLLQDRAHRHRTAS